VSRQKLTASKTTHDNEYRIHAVTAEKRQKCVSRQKTLRCRSIVCLSFFDLGATCTVQSNCSIRPLFFFFTFTKLGQTTWAGLVLEAIRSPLPGATERSQVSETSARAQRRSGVGRPGLSAAEPRLNPVSERAKPGPRSTTEMVWARASGAWFHFFFGRSDLLIARSSTSHEEHVHSRQLMEEEGDQRLTQRTRNPN
jgi:hypothetical protein